MFLDIFYRFAEFDTSSVYIYIYGREHLYLAVRQWNQCPLYSMICRSYGPYTAVTYSANVVPCLGYTPLSQNTISPNRIPILLLEDFAECGTQSSVSPDFVRNMYRRSGLNGELEKISFLDLHNSAIKCASLTQYSWTDVKMVALYCRI